MTFPSTQHDKTQRNHARSCHAPSLTTGTAWRAIPRRSCASFRRRKTIPFMKVHAFSCVKIHWIDRNVMDHLRTTDEARCTSPPPSPLHPRFASSRGAILHAIYWRSTVAPCVTKLNIAAIFIVFHFFFCFLFLTTRTRLSAHRHLLTSRSLESSNQPG